MIKGLLSVSIMSVTAAILLTGCGGGDDTATTPTASTGYYVDAAVSGVSYVCGDQNGTTGTDGSFKFQKDQGCTFSLAGITLRTIAAANLVDQVKILEDNVSVAQMLQTLDSDGNASNGITITSAVIAAVRTANITTPPADDTAATALYTAVRYVTGYTGSVKTIVETNAHLIEAQTPILKELIKGKTFYIADSYNSVTDLVSVTFNAEVTSVTSILLATDDSTETIGATNSEVIELNGTKIMFNNADHIYEQFEGQTADYILLRSDDGSLVRAYSNKAKAEAYYATLNSTSTPTTFVASTLLAGKTFYDVAKDSSGKWIDRLTINSAGTSMTAEEGLETGSVTQTSTNATTISGGRITVFESGATGYADIIEVTDDYIVIRTEDNGIERLYSDQAKAQAYYNTL